jgi:hypothetical protein
MRLCLVAVLWLGPGLAVAQPAADTDLPLSEQTLKQAGVPLDGPGLLRYLKTRTLSEADRQKLADTIPKLGHRSFKVREQALRFFVEAGRNAVPYLEKALANPDAEVRNRAARALETIRRVPQESVLAAVARVLAARRPEGTVPALLAYFPSVDEQLMEEAFLEALAAVALNKDKVDAAVVAALKDKDPARRAAAAYVHGRATPPQTRPLQPLLKDAEPKVRYQAAEALARARDKEAVPVLIGLLADGSRELAWQAEDLLGRLAGEKGPQTSVGAGDPDSRTTARKAWDGWWKDNAAKIKLADVNSQEHLRGLTVIAELDGSGMRSLGRVWECGRDGKVRWENDSSERPADAWVLPGGNFLAAEHNPQRVTERDRNGKVLWSHQCRNSPVSCQRLPNGNVFIATYNEVLEVTRAGKEIYAYRRPHMIFSAQKLRNGRIVYAHGSNGVVELDAATGKEIRAIPITGTGGWAGVEKLRNGHYLVARYGAGRVTEIDASGKQYFDVAVSTPGYATRLPNGNTLVCSIGDLFVVEYDRSGKEVWRQQTKGRPFRVHRR